MTKLWGYRGFSAGLTALILAGLGAAGAQATQGQLPYSSGSYSGTIAQQSPRPYTGRISFVVAGQTLSHVVFAVGANCSFGGAKPQTLWVSDYDPTSGVQTSISRTGAFSYSGTVNGRQIRFHGYLRNHSAHGAFFQSFSLLDGTCSMDEPASYTAAR